MKKIFASMLTVVIAFSAVAQNNESKKNNGKHKGAEMGKHKGDEMRRSGPQQVRRQGTIGAINSVNLTDAQKQQLQQLNDTHKQQMQELNKNESITVKEQKERREAINKQHRESVQNLLTPEQRTAIQEEKKLREERKDKFNDKRRKGGEMMGRGDDRDDRGGDRGDHLKQLNLSDDQGARIKAVNEEFRTKVQAIQKNASLSNDQKKVQRDLAQTQHTAAIKAILTQEQKDKLEALKATRPDRRGKKK
jgi:Spy/CpxP family protein refolding chaperone